VLLHHHLDPGVVYNFDFVFDPGEVLRMIVGV
jgi:hypothetical protein